MSTPRFKSCRDAGLFIHSVYCEHSVLHPGDVLIDLLMSGALSRAEFIAAVVRVRGSLSPEEAREAEDMLDRLLKRTEDL